MNTALKRIYGNRQAKQLALEKPRRLVVVDRGLDGDRAFAEMQFKAGLFDAQQKAIYDEEIGVDDGSALAWRSEPGFCTVYLRCTPETAWRRVLMRNIPGEVASYSLKYLENLYDSHEFILAEDNVVVIDWDNDLDLVNGRLEDLVKTKILDLI
jgi:thymidylate kinase